MKPFPHPDDPDYWYDIEDWAKIARTEIEVLKLLITKREQLQLEYIKLLGEEINDMVGIASIHGWKSKNSERGKELREKLEIE